MQKIHYLIGDATEPIKKPALIFHCNDDAGGWGRGFVLALSKKYPAAEVAYREWFKIGTPKLGEIQIVPNSPPPFSFTKEEVFVANMIAQHGTQWVGKIPPIRYNALDYCVKQAYEYAASKGLTIHGPRLGCVLAGGEWPKIEKILEKHISVETYIYTLPEQANRWKNEYEEIK